MTQEFINSGFDTQKMIKLICKSRTYQLSIKTNQWNQGDDINYSHAVARRLPAEALYDAILRVTGTTSHIPGLPAGARAAQVLDGSVDLPSGFLELFGKPLRESACECERSSGLMLGPILNLVNGPIVADAIKDPTNRIAQLAVKAANDQQFIEELYLATLARSPNATEIKLGLKALQDADGDYKMLKARRDEQLQALKNLEKQIDARQPTWEKSLSMKTQWDILMPDPKRTFAKNRKGTTLQIAKDGVVFVTGANPNPEQYTVSVHSALKKITALRLDVLADDRLSDKGPGRAPNGNFVLSEVKASVRIPGGPQTRLLELHKPQATFSQDNFNIAGVLDGNLSTGWAIAPQFGKNHSALFELKQPLMQEKGADLVILLDQNFNGAQHNIGKFRLWATADPNPRLGDTLPQEMASILLTPPEKRSAMQQEKLAQYHRSNDAEWNRLNGQLLAEPLPVNHRVLGGQDLMWALINNPAFLFNH